MNEMNIKEMKTMAHFLGVRLFESVMSKKMKDKVLPSEYYRNYYNVGQDDLIDSLVEKGMCREGQKGYWHLTDEGIETFEKQFRNTALYYKKDNPKWLRQRINFYCDFYNYRFCDDNSEHVVSAFKNYFLKKHKMSHTTTDVVTRFNGDLRKFHKSGEI